MTIEEMQDRKRSLGLSYEMISQLSGVPLGTVQKVLGGITKSPRRDTLVALERVLGKSVSGYSKSICPADQEKRECQGYRKSQEYMKFQEQQAESGILRESAYNYGSSARADIPVKKQGEYTLDDYLALPDDQRYELIDGVLYGMSAPTINHQDLAGELYFQIRQYIKSKKGNCKALISPVDVQLDADDRTVVQPDVVIVCDRQKLENGKRIFGAPDLVAEVLSDTTARRDLTIKYYKYRAAGVREYWIIDPENRHVTAHRFASGRADLYTFEQDIPVGIYENECKVNFSDI